MSYFFCGNKLSLGAIVEIQGEEARHILLSRRMKPGQKLNLQDPDIRRYLAEVVSTDKKSLKVKILETVPVPKEPKIEMTLCQSVVSESALDFILQKGTELGMSRLLLFNSANTATKLTKVIFDKKYSRWQKIVMESAKQCDRGCWPKIEYVEDIQKLKLVLEKNDRIILSDFAGKPFASAMASGIKSVALVVGPEGGFTTEEISEFKIFPKAETVNLGPVLLRADTAALASLVLFGLGAN